MLSQNPFMQLRAGQPSASPTAVPVAAHAMD